MNTHTGNATLHIKPVEDRIVCQCDIAHNL